MDEKSKTTTRTTCGQLTALHIVSTVDITKIK